MPTEPAKGIPLAPQHDYGAYHDAMQFMRNMKPEYRVCRRRRRHDFENGKQEYGAINADGSLHTETRCNDCGTLIIEDATAWGYYIKKPRYIWPDGYCKLPDESGIVAGEDASAAMRAMRMYASLGTAIPDNVIKMPTKRRTNPGKVQGND